MCNKWYKPLVFSLALLSVAPAYGMSWFRNFANSPQMQEFADNAEGADNSFTSDQDGVHDEVDEIMLDMTSEEGNEELSDTTIDGIMGLFGELANSPHMRKLVESMSEDLSYAYNSYKDGLKRRHEENMEELRGRANDMSTSKAERDAAAAELLRAYQERAKSEEFFYKLQYQVFQQNLGLLKPLIRSLVGELASKTAQNEEAQERVEELKKTAANMKLPKWLRDIAQGELIQEVLSGNEENEEVEKIILFVKKFDELVNTIQLPKWLCDAVQEKSGNESDLNSNND